MKLSVEQIREIADNLDAGLKCFYNLKTGEIKTLLNFDNWAGADMEPWKEEVMEIEENWNDYFEFKGFESHESFEIMADFADNIDNESLRQELFIALNRSKPFQNFKRIIDYSGKYRQRWFDYKEMRYIQWVEKQIDWENIRDSIQKDDSPNSN